MPDRVKPHVNEAIDRLFSFYMKWLIVAGIILYLLTGIYSVDRDETAVLQRFGKIVQSSVQPADSDIQTLRDEGVLADEPVVNKAG